MRHRLEKGIVSVALGVSMAFSMCPATVIAEEYADQTANEQEEASQETDQPDSQPGDTEDTKDTEEESSTDAQTHDGITFEAWTATDSLPTTAGNYYLANDVTLSDPWEAPMGESRLDLNGKSIKRDAGEKSVAIEVPTAAFLDLYDYAGSGAIQPSEGAFVAHGVDVYEIGAFKMHAGTIKGFGLGVHVSQAVFEMSGGLITQNGDGTDAESIGGGVYFTPDGKSTFNLTGGEISYNKAGLGAGVYVPGNVAASFSGAPKVTGNTAGDVARNVYFAKGDSAAAGFAVFAVTGKFVQGASIGVTKDMEGGDETAPVFTEGFELENPDVDPAAYFASDDDAYVIAQTLLGEGYFVRGYNVRLAEGIEHGTVTLSKTKAVEGDTVTITATAEEGYALATLTATDAEGKAVTITENAFVMPASEVTVNATFEAENMLTVTFDPNGGEGSMAPAKVVAGKDTKLPTSTFTRSGYIFASWNTKPDGTGTRISNGATVKVTSDVTLYAQWAKSGTASTGTASSTTAGSVGSTATTLAKTTDPTSVAAVAAMVAAGAGAAFVGTRKNRKQ